MICSALILDILSNLNLIKNAQTLRACGRSLGIALINIKTHEKYLNFYIGRSLLLDTYFLNLLILS